jgi:hypothetical protein
LEPKLRLSLLGNDVDMHPGFFPAEEEIPPSLFDKIPWGSSILLSVVLQGLGSNPAFPMSSPRVCQRMMIILRVERAVNLSKAERRLVRGSGGESRRISNIATSLPLWRSF